MPTIDKDHTDLDALRWVARAIFKDKLNSRLNLGIICVRGRQAIGTDGHRLHIADVDTIPDGCYKVIKNNKTRMELVTVTDIDFPDVSKIFWPTEKAQKQRDVYMNGNNRWGLYINFVRDLSPLNADYFFDLLDGQGEFVAYVKTDKEPVYFKADKKQGFIMPINI